MIIYIVFYIVVFLLSFKISKEKFNIYDVVLLTIIILFSGLRSAGLDYFLYKNIFNSNFLLESRTGIGFSYLMYIVKEIFNWKYQGLIFIISLLTNISPR